MSCKKKQSFAQRIDSQMKLSQPQVISNCEKKEHCFEGEHWASRLKTPSSKIFICTSGTVSSLLYDPTNKFDMHIVIHSQITHSTVDSIQKFLNRTWKKPFFLYSDQTNGSILHSAFRNTSYSCMHLKPPDIQLLEIEFHFTLIFILALFLSVRANWTYSQTTLQFMRIFIYL